MEHSIASEESAMEHSIASEENFSSAESRPLSDAELDNVGGGLLFMVPATFAFLAIMHIAAR